MPVCPRCRTRIQPAVTGGCTRCQHPALAETTACPLCEEWPAGLVRARSAAAFQGPAASLVRALKYEGWRAAVPALAGPVTRLVRTDPRLRDSRFVTWVPSTARRLRRRGFNPAELLGRQVAAALDRPCDALLSRPREGPRQAGLPASERLHNVRGAFAPARHSPGAVRGTDVLLVDDVLTTGATVSEAARCLLAAGARQVAVATFARAFQPLPGTPPDPS